MPPASSQQLHHQGLLAELPDELLIYIFVFLPGDKLSQINRVCKYWSSIIHWSDTIDDIEEAKKRKKIPKKQTSVSKPASAQQLQQQQANEQQLQQLQANHKIVDIHAYVEKLSGLRGRDFWIHLSETHFRQAMITRRKYPSRIRPLTFYVQQFRTDCLAAQIRVWENCTRSIESMLEEYTTTAPSSSGAATSFFDEVHRHEEEEEEDDVEDSGFGLNDFEDFASPVPGLPGDVGIWIRDICVFSEDLYKLYRQLYLLDKYYEGNDSKMHPFDKYGLEETIRSKGHLNPLCNPVEELQCTYHLAAAQEGVSTTTSHSSAASSETCVLEKPRRKKMVAVVKLNEGVVNKAFDRYYSDYLEKQRLSKSPINKTREELYNEMVTKKVNQTFTKHWIKRKWRHLLHRQEKFMKEEKEAMRQDILQMELIEAMNKHHQQQQQPGSGRGAPAPPPTLFHNNSLASSINIKQQNRITVNAADIVMWKLSTEYALKNWEDSLSTNFKPSIDVKIINDSFTRKNELRLANSWLNRRAIYSLFAQDKLN